MKERIIELLAYPRSMVCDQIDLDICPHAGYFDRDDRRCRKCQVAPECRWLGSNDEFAALKQKSTEELVAPLGFAVDFVNIQVAHWGHDPLCCDCETCLWVRAATRVREELAPGSN